MTSLRAYCRAILIVTTFAFARASLAQQPAPAPGFDVVSIRENTTHDQHTHNSIYNSWKDARFRATNLPVKMLLEFSFGMPESRILGLPGWADTTTFDLEARSDDSADAEMGKLPPEEARQQKLAMLQALLAERFKLVTHIESRELPIYQLVVAKGGAKLKPNPGGNSFGTGRNTIHVQGGDDSLAILADKLADAVGRVVVNQTGMTGQFDMRLAWTPEDQPPPMLNGAPDPNPPPDIFTAIQEQLGLKLEPGKGPVPVLVVDHVERPSEN
jgi:uncharacterized protein (TIGR03435 family)